MKSRSLQNARRGFTLLELLMVISIISLLVALILPAAMSVTTRAKEADVYSEIMGLSNALDSFKARYGVYPPSSITLYEKSSDWNLPAARPHRAMIRRIFGTEFDFGIDRDINGNGSKDDVIVLTGQECLVFFLGGIPRPDGKTWEMAGFSANRRDPFSRVGNSRIKFFASFSPDRLVDGNSNGMPEYLPKYSVTVPLLYFSTTTERAFPNPSNVYLASDCPGTLDSVYMQSATQPFKADAFQIISAGWDGKYGAGGELRDASGNTLLIGSRDVERDNIANFSGSPLEN